MCKPTVIARKGKISVSQCSNCKMVNIWNQNVLISFSFQQFHAFIETTKDLDFDNYMETSPNGLEVVVLATPYPDISLVFTRKEWYNFFEALQEAAYMQQIYKMVHFS
ncbi:hypothetical protein LPB86_17380 [Pedobacter sp. MC2016-14]|uniref:hypothetical protein n=1 Tax=Pedobacter sp. MC2016-14 TaxID=2897327 RepID=UPI001E45E2B1|nr:hypothetical protein [Pedobacter sp. MC2016-14]MCD0490018.1 hypothetical protein [Pedobacter sp. MC2016-14]